MVRHLGRLCHAMAPRRVCRFSSDDFIKEAVENISDCAIGFPTLLLVYRENFSSFGNLQKKLIVS